MPSATITPRLTLCSMNSEVGIRPLRGRVPDTAETEVSLELPCISAGAAALGESEVSALWGQDVSHAIATAAWCFLANSFAFAACPVQHRGDASWGAMLAKHTDTHHALHRRGAYALILLLGYDQKSRLTCDINPIRPSLYMHSACC
jgi:hypothetical protein